MCSPPLSVCASAAVATVDYCMDTLCSLSSIILVPAMYLSLMCHPPNTSIQTQWAPRWNTDTE